MLMLLVLGLRLSYGQAAASTNSTSTNTEPTTTQLPVKDAWSFDLSVYTYFVPDGNDYAQPTFIADRGAVHLEARYNYENLDTGSVWLGRNFAGGDDLAWAFTPMLGCVFGNTTGLAPGYRGSLGWRKLELYSEGEYVFDTGNSSKDFFYNWSELTLAPVDWFRFGLVTQRTKAYETDRDIQRGVLVGLSAKRIDLTTCVFNPDESHPTVTVSIALSF